MSLYPTPHIAATPSDFGKTVLMPGDPLRSKFIAEHFLEQPRLINNIRGVQGYTGNYHGVPVTVMASGMGMPSMGIYSYELFNFLEVDNIIRIGSAGAIADNVKMRDIILGIGACTNSAYGDMYGLVGTFAPVADYALLRTAADKACELKLPCHVGNFLSSDNYYSDDDGDVARWVKMGVLAIEMEAAALYLNAARSGKRALAICTVSNHITLGGDLTAEERQNGFTDMMTLALETAVELEALPKLTARK